LAAEVHTMIGHTGSTIAKPRTTCADFAAKG
jgi:hypothetical protein